MAHRYLRRSAKPTRANAPVDQTDARKPKVKPGGLLYPKAGHGFFNKDPHFTLTFIEADKFLASLGWLEGPPTVKPNRE